MADQTESSIDIDAPASLIMDVIADLPAYPSWSDGITQVSVLEEKDGRPLRARFHLESGPIRDTYELLYEWEGDREVSWTLTSGDMLKAMDGTYLLDAHGDTTTVHYRLAVDVKIPMIGMIKRKAEKVIVDTALKGLRKRVAEISPA
ncbi:MAG: SRPBCC family protein [Actinomycetales bacterium]|nr:SRPBCC family protein [Actinomycetales bacterium]